MNRYLALGDSYTIGEAVATSDSFPYLLVQHLKEEGYDFALPTIIAQTGWTTGELLSAMDKASLEKKYDLVTLLIGVNNQYRGLSLEEYKKEFSELLDKAIALAKKKQVLVLSIPDYGYTPFGKSNQGNISQEIDKFNSVNEAVAEQKNIAYLSITDISRRTKEERALIAEDDLHPSAEMYALWVERLVPEVKKLIVLD